MKTFVAINATKLPGDVLLKMLKYFATLNIIEINLQNVDWSMETSSPWPRQWNEVNYVKIRLQNTIVNVSPTFSRWDLEIFFLSSFVKV